MHFISLMDKICKMRRHPVRKFVGLTVLYAAIILGIFVLQFKTESIISRNLGGMRLTLAQSETENNIMELRNQLQVSFKGIILSFDDKNPVLSLGKDGKEKNLKLASWDEKGELAADFFFNDGSVMTVSVSDRTPTAQFSVSAMLSDDTTALIVPYKTASNYLVGDTSEKSTVLSLKDDYTIFSAPLLQDGKVWLQKQSPVASLLAYNPVQSFSFEKVLSLPGADRSSYDAAVRALRSSVQSRVAQKLSGSEADRVTESEMIAYVAEMAAGGRFEEAINSAPETFVRGNSRTYLSAPYFARLVDMNRTLTTQTERYSSMVDGAITSGNASIFTIEGIEDYLIRIKRTSRGRSLLQAIASKQNFTPSLAQAASIIHVYEVLRRNDETYAALLEPVIPSCLDAIRNACSLNDGVLDLTENGFPVTTQLSVQAGQALFIYGSLFADEGALSAGCLLVSQALSMPQNVEVRILSELYPLLVKNSYYPHMQILGYYGTAPVWAWTCAQNVTYEIGEEDIVSIHIDFPQGLTQYLMILGVPDFHAQIEIQQIPFRTDPRFETYNSSGYVYRSEEKALFLKSKHKSRNELVRLWCDPAVNFIKP